MKQSQSRYSERSLGSRLQARRASRGPRRLLLGIGAALVATYLAVGGGLSGIAASSARAAPSATYNCGTNGTCYGQTRWPGSNDGGVTWISVAQMTCNPADCYNSFFGLTTGFVTDEMWIEDTRVGGVCIQNSFHACWIEVGYSTFTDGSGTTEQYFWGQTTPNGIFSSTPLGAIPSADYGNSTFFQVSGTGASGPFSWAIISGTKDLSMSNIANGMSPNWEIIGQELYGTQGASANRAYFTDNQWKDTHTGNFNYQPVDGNPLATNPPYQGWSIHPANSSTGGKMWTNT